MGNCAERKYGWLIAVILPLSLAAIALNGCVGLRKETNGKPLRAEVVSLDDRLENDGTPTDREPKQREYIGIPYLKNVPLLGHLFAWPIPVEEDFDSDNSGK